jgi:CubicO group peptidase (beta-lactamase class C family)
MSNELCQRIATELERRMIESGMPSVAFAIAQDGKIVHEQGLGYADREKKTPTSTQTLYPIASVTKTFTGMAIMKLVDRGLVDLDQPINNYLAPEGQVPVWIGEPKDVTVRRVANHSAGMPTYARSYRAGEKISLDESITRYANVVAPPGERYGYSNIGYAVLARLIERVSGLSYAEFIEREIFRPLGMQHAYVGLPLADNPLCATIYDWEDKPVIPDGRLQATDHQSASSALCSVHDLISLGLFHLGHLQPGQTQVISPKSVAAMQSLTFPMNPGRSSDFNVHHESIYGIGWVLDNDELGVRVSHAGGMDGCASKLLIMPKERLVIALLSNVFNKALYALENNILSHWLPGYTERLEAYRARTAAMPEHLPASPELQAKLPGKWRGAIHTYEGKIPLELSFTSATEGQVQFLEPRHEPSPTPLKDLKLIGTRLIAGFAGVIHTSDIDTRVRLPGHTLRLDLTLRGQRLCGLIYSHRGNVLNHWVDLSREV